MPIYEYQCQACGRRSSALLPRFDAPDPPCPNCGSDDVRRLVSSFATHRSEEADFGGGDGDWDGGGMGDDEGGDGGGWDGDGDDDF